ncbi:hypothetical protein FB107DRAFT_216375 [Schizophyllum commune]
MAPVPIPAASVCFRCQNPGSSPEKFMLQCCECKRTWHHTCHAPPVPEKDLIEGIRAFNDNHVENIFTMWTCKRCGKKPKAVQSRATSRVVDEHRATTTAPPGPPTGVPPRQPAVAPQKPAAVVPPSRLEVAPMPKYFEPPAPPPLKRDAPPKPSTTTSQARPRVAEAEAQRAASAQRQSNHFALPVQITTPRPTSRSTTQGNPYGGRLADTLKDTTSKKPTSSKRTAKAPVPATAATASTLAPTTYSTPPTASSGPSTTSWRLHAPLLRSTTSFASTVSLQSTATSSKAMSSSSLGIIRPRCADGTVIDLGDRLEEMNVDTPDPGSTPHSASPVPRATRTGVRLDEITALLRARPVLPVQVRTLAGPKAPVPGVSLPYEWLSQKKMEGEAKRSRSQSAAPQRRSRKAVATKGRMLQPEILLIGGAVAGA